eukprot:gene11206-21365_t
MTVRWTRARCQDHGQTNEQKDAVTKMEKMGNLELKTKEKSNKRDKDTRTTKEQKQMRGTPNERVVKLNVEPRAA